MAVEKRSRRSHRVVINLCRNAQVECCLLVGVSGACICCLVLWLGLGLRPHRQRSRHRFISLRSFLLQAQLQLLEAPSPQSIGLSHLPAPTLAKSTHSKAAA